MTKRAPNILIVEDLVTELEKYLLLLRKEHYSVTGVRTLADAKGVLARIPVDVVLTDIHLSQDLSLAEGFNLLEMLASEYPHIAPIAMSADPNVEIANKAKGIGALQFLKKPMFTADEIRIAIDIALEQKQLRESHHRLVQKSATVLPPDLLQRCPDGIVISKEHDNLIRGIARNGEIPIIILGETGTGKEEIAKLIHRRRAGVEGNLPFISVNCANLSGDLVASTLFGHKKGAFTGADKASIGLIGEADGGILFLDEIHSLSMDVQRRLLRVLNDGSYTRVGDTLELKSCFQVIAATTKDLDEEVEKGGFLIDLRTRLTGIDLILPPLRERGQDIPTLIALYFAREKSAILEKGEFERLVARCEEFFWQGNIRQLYKVLGTLCVMASLNDEPVRAERLPVFKTMFAPADASGVQPKAPATFEKSSSSLADEKYIKARKLLDYCQSEDVALDEVVEAVEEYVIAAALKRHKSVAQAATGLKTARSSLDAKRKKYGI